MNSSENPPISTVKRWEEARESLVAASREYLDLCPSLGSKSVFEYSNTRELISKIEPTLAMVHRVIYRNLDESSSALARIQNKLTSLTSRLPEEIISKIFMNVIYDSSNSEVPKPMQQEIWLIYRRIYVLLSVCCAWRDIVTNTGAIWSMIPVVSVPSASKWGPFGLSLQRSSRSMLYLAAATDSGLSGSLRGLVSVLAEHASRFRAINMSIYDPAEIGDIIHGLLQHNTLGSLSELSIQCTGILNLGDELPQNEEYIAHRNTPQYTSLVSLMETLTTFRICGVHIYWDAMAFSSRLVELRIEDIIFGYDETIAPFVQALSSAPSLRDLKIISVITFRRLGTITTPSSTPLPCIALPALCSLLLHNLFLNTFEQLLPLILHDSNNLSVFLTPKSVLVKTLEGEFSHDDGFDRLRSIMNRTPIGSLMIDGHAHNEWLTMARVATLIKGMSSLKTLKVHKWNFGKGLSEHLTRADETPSSSGPGSPALENLHLTSVLIHSQQEFQNMISSHPLRHVVLGGILQVAPQDRRLLREDSSIVQGLRTTIPGLELRLVGYGYYPPEFQDFNSGLDPWQLW